MNHRLTLSNTLIENNKWFCLCKFTIDDYHMMGEFLIKGIFATIKAFYDEVDGIKYNKFSNKSNLEMADNSIIVNTLARKAHAEILDAKLSKKVKSVFRRESRKQIIKRDKIIEPPSEEDLGNFRL